MRSFQRLLMRLLTSRGISQSEFARRVGVSPAAINRALLGKHVPRSSRGPAWARALCLRGKDARAFQLALDLANSPASVQRLVARLSRR